MRERTIREKAPKGNRLKKEKNVKRKSIFGKMNLQLLIRSRYKKELSKNRDIRKNE